MGIALRTNGQTVMTHAPLTATAHIDTKVLQMVFGSIPALVTPFSPDGTFDEPAFREFVEWQIAEGSTALVVCGTTGEAATLTPGEHFGVVRVCVEQARRRVPVIAGAGSNDTRVGVALDLNRGLAD